MSEGAAAELVGGAEAAARRWGWRPVLVAAALVAGLAFGAALFAEEHWASAEDVGHAAAEHREEHRALERRLDGVESAGDVNRALLERANKSLDDLNRRLTDYPIERHGR